MTTRVVGPAGRGDDVISRGDKSRRSARVMAADARTRDDDVGGPAGAERTLYFERRSLERRRAATRHRHRSVDERRHLHPSGNNRHRRRVPRYASVQSTCGISTTVLILHCRSI